MSVTPRLPDDPARMPAVARRPAPPQRRVAAAGRDAQQAETPSGPTTPDAASTSSNACSTRPRPTTTNCRKNTPSWPRRLALLRRYLFGPRRERSHRRPGPRSSLRPPRRSSPSPSRPRPPRPTTRRRSRPRPARPPRRTRLDHLPHIRIEHDLPEAEKTCSCCGGPKQRIGEDESRELEFIPAKLEVKVHVLPKYACPKCRDGVASPPVPPKPIPGGIAGPGPGRLRGRQQVRRSSPALSTRRYLDATRRVPVAEHLVRLGPERRRSCSSRWPSCRRRWCCSRR